MHFRPVKKKICSKMVQPSFANLTFHADRPDLPECFQLTVLSWLPCICLWAASPLYLLYLKRNNRGYIMMSIVNRLKTAFGLLLWIVCWADLFYTIHQRKEFSPPPVYYVTPLVLGMTMLLATFLIQLERLRGVQSSGVLFIFWFLSVLCAIVPFRSKILQSGVDNAFQLTTFYLYFGLIVCELILCCFNEKPPLFSSVVTDPNPCPENTAGFLSTITFWWFTRMAIKGYKKPLEAKDLWSLNQRDSSKNMVPKLLLEWDRELAKAKSEPNAPPSQAMYSKPPPSTTNHVGGADSRSPEEGEVLLSSRKAPSRQPSFMRALVKAFGPYFLIGSAFKLLQDVITFVNPQLLRMLISFIKQKGVPDWWGYALAFLMFFTAVLQTLILHQHFQYCFVTGMNVRTAIIGAIYRKVLPLPEQSGQSLVHRGEVVNLMSVDAQRFMDLTTFLNMLWSAPIQIMLALYFLWQNLGPSVLAGVAVMILLIPLNAFIAMKTRAFQVEQMQYKDERIKLMNEILNGIKVLKLYAWEKSFIQKVLAIRQKELNVLRKTAILGALSTMAWTSAPFMVALTTFAVYVTVDENNVLDAEKAFVSLSLFNILRFPLNMLPQVISSLVQASVSLKRIQSFLSHNELDPESVDKKGPGTEFAVTVINGMFTWDRQDPPVLHSINMMVPQGSLLAVVGHVGCGKSSLISALLGEMEKTEGDVSVRGSVAYVPQQAWIQNASLRDNILFGKALDECKYRSVLEACALTPDLEVLPGGDMTEIGEKGINLSGGQRQRVSLARALYSDADVYLLDDPLSAVDSHVAKHIFDNLIGPEGALKGKTRILVTHGITFLPQVHNIMVMVEGRVSEMGSYQELLKQNGAFAEFLRNYTLEDIIEEDEANEEELFPEDALSNHTDIVASEPTINEAKRSFLRQISIISADGEGMRCRSVKRSSCSQRKHMEAQEKKKPQEVDKLIQAETAETGKVKVTVYLEYAKAVGLVLSVVICLLYGCQSAAAIGANVWLSDWTNDAATNRTQERVNMRVGVYAALGIAQGILVMISSLTLYMGNVGAARKLHFNLVTNKLHTPQSFYDTTPIGRIINRFSKDVYVIDEALPATVLMFLGTFFVSLSTLIVIVSSTPIFAVVVVPLIFVYIFVQRFYVATSRQLKRLESVSRSPIYSHFSETITGSSVIRAYGRESAFVRMSDSKVDDNQKSYYRVLWLGVRIEFIGNCIVLFAALFAVTGKESLSPGLVGLSVSYALQVHYERLARCMSKNDKQISAPWEIQDKKPPPDWPTQGNVQFKDYSVRYREGLDLVLKNLSISVTGGEKIGIVGRTGAGKSSMTLCLFDCELTGLYYQSEPQLCFTPRAQEPVLFSGTLRMNLDPFDAYSDEEVWKVLQHAHLHKFVSNQPAQLLLECAEGGENLSMGQRQLVCLARALLRKSRILILDEATASIDLETDDLIQSTIRTQFEECTVFTIAHRLNTIMDYTRVLVLDKGKIAEFDTPTNLLSKRGIFYGMAKDAGLV
uniref:ABC-type glutathione-S-conjugate transporter n=1 Tax=Neogobius melanostomus TaxID=47308 RepID=A0A8C6TSD5_9GOBI